MHEGRADLIFWTGSKEKILRLGYVRLGFEMNPCHCKHGVDK